MTFKYTVNDRRLGPAIARELDQEADLRTIENVMEETIPTLREWWKNCKKGQYIAQHKNYVVLNPHDYDMLKKELDARKDMRIIEDIMEEADIKFTREYMYDPYEIKVTSYPQFIGVNVNKLGNK